MLAERLKEYSSYGGGFDDITDLVVRDREGTNRPTVVSATLWKSLSKKGKKEQELLVGAERNACREAMKELKARFPALDFTTVSNQAESSASSSSPPRAVVVSESP